MKLVFLMSVLAALGPGCHGYASFRDQIPNGNQVPHPCKANFLWQGVGHLNPGGGGVRNAFGVDFNQNGKVWDATLCSKDSDGDGKSNGEELGDPDCVWTVGQVPEQTSGLSHPGVCEPVDSPDCQVRNKDLGDFCELGDEVNPCIEDIKKQDGVRSLTLSFPETPVPGLETNYMCQIFALPNDTDYHIISTEPHIVNKNVMHHIIVFGCEDSVEVTEAPEECGMAESVCRDVLLIWTVGYNGNCLNEAFGFRIGQSGYSKVMMQAHWNNPELRTDYTDSSGMVVYYTPNLRPNDGGIMTVGQAYLEIPGGQADHTETGLCDSSCTSGLTGSFYLAETLIHMHYLGSKGYIEHFRDGTKVTDLVIQDIYSYDTPIPFSYDTPVEFRPGDSIKTTCHFKSTSRSEVTYWGESTRAEMCLGFLTYYPKAQGIKRCLSYKETPLCRTNAERPAIESGPCNVTAFLAGSQDFFQRLYMACDDTGETCYPGCPSMLSVWSEAQPCLRGEALATTKLLLLQYGGDQAAAAVKVMESCDDQSNETPKEETEGGEEETEDGEEGCSGPNCPEDGTQKPASSATAVIPTLASVIAAVLGAITRRL